MGLKRDYPTFRATSGSIEQKRKVLWIDLFDGLHDVGLLKKIGAIFSNHRLTLGKHSKSTNVPKMKVLTIDIFAYKKWSMPNPRIDVKGSKFSAFLLMDDVLDPFRKKGGCFRTYVRRADLLS